jgi:hypothetical protein
MCYSVSVTDNLNIFPLHTKRLAVITKTYFTKALFTKGFTITVIPESYKQMVNKFTLKTPSTKIARVSRSIERFS